jgi:hypothetical protein
MDAQLRVSDAGGITAIVAAMMAHPSDASVQENGCAALDTLSACVRWPKRNRNCASPFGPTNVHCVALRCVALHAAWRTLRAPRGGRQRVELPVRCALLCRHSNNKRRVADAGGISAVVNGMLAHARVATVQEYA